MIDGRKEKGKIMRRELRKGDDDLKRDVLRKGSRLGFGAEASSHPFVTPPPSLFAPNERRNCAVYFGRRL